MLYKKLLVLLTLILSTSCIATSNYNYREQDIFSEARDTFVKIETHVVMGNCDKSKCETAHSERLSVGSGFFIGEDRLGTLVATAAHVCGEEALVKNARSFFGNLSIEIVVVNRVITVDYRTYEMEVLKVDKKKDLCLARIKGLYNEPYLYFSNRIPNAGEQIYNVSAPAGAMNKNAPAMVKGIFSGNDEMYNLAVITMPVTQGASGSAIIDFTGKVVGIVSMKHTDVDYIVYSPSLISILNFY